MGKDSLKEWWAHLDQSVDEQHRDDLQIRELREMVLRVLEGSPPVHAQWASREAGCSLYSSQFYRALNSDQKAKWMVVRTAEKAPLNVNGVRLLQSPMHTFLKDGSTPLEGDESEVLLDLTWAQYVPEASIPESELIFLGTRKQLIHVFDLHRKHIVPSIFYQIETPSYSVDPQEFTEAHYGFGRGANIRRQ